MNAQRFEPHRPAKILALILAGGQGTRLQSLTTQRAKPSVPFGGKYRIIDFTLSNCVNSGIRNIGVLTQYKSNSLMKHLTNGWSGFRTDFGEFLDILPAQQHGANNSWYQGTADAVYQNIDRIRSCKPDYVLVLAGDHVYKTDYRMMLEHHLATDAQMTVGCIRVPKTQGSEFGIMSIDTQCNVIGFQEKPRNPFSIPGQPEMALASMGFYLFDTDFLISSLQQDAQQQKSNRDFGKDIIPNAIGQKKRVVAYPFFDEKGKSGYWRDVGTVDSFWECNLELIGVSPELDLYDRHWPIWTHQSQLPPAKFVFNDDGRRGMAVDSMISAGCIISGAQIIHSLLFNNVKVHSSSDITDSVILPDCEIGKNCKIKNAIIDKGCVIPDNTVIGEDLAIDRTRYHVSPKGVVLVSPEMLKQDIHYAA